LKAFSNSVSNAGGKEADPERINRNGQRLRLSRF